MGRSLEIGGKDQVSRLSARENIRVKSLLLSTASVASLCLSSPALANSLCDQSGDPWICTFNVGAEVTYVNLTATGASAGAQAPGITIQNYSQQNMVIPTSQGLYANWYVESRGSAGEDSGAAGAGGTVTIVNQSNIDINVSEVSQFAMGIFAQSSGGEGDQSNGDNNSNGGAGGNGGSVQVTNNGIAGYTAFGYANFGFATFVAESKGGTGGNQNNSVLSDQYGGKGGDGGSVTVDNTAPSSFSVGSSDDRFQGLGEGGGFIARSLGGSGGDNNGNAGAGGTVTIDNAMDGNIYWDVTTSGGDGLFVLYGLSAGGAGIASTDNSDDGGDGGNGGNVSITNASRLVLDVTGNNYEPSAAIGAKSIGGKGGTGPTKDQSGGNGGTAGSVSVALENGKSIETSGVNVYGVLAQSIGGEGGNGSDGTALAGTGGGGGFGGDAGTVSVTVSGGTSVETSGAFSAAIALHSIGGGGGTGSDFQSVLGGSGGNGGNGGDAGNVYLSLDNAAVATAADHAFGIVAQSIAGSGGTGGIDASTFVGLGGDGAGGGAAGTVTVNSSAGITTNGFNSLGIIAQSVGGGGGAAGSSSGFVSIGGSAAGSTTSNGSYVGVSNTQKVTTKGDSSTGILAQSIGGGGGSGGDATGTVGVGGQGAAGGNGGTVAITNIGSIVTSGGYSPGAVFQSIGGGGGNGGSVQTLSTIASIGVGGSADLGGDGGEVCVDNTGGCVYSDLPSLQAATSNGHAHITTTGVFAPGLIAQSIGGGGGNGGSVKNFSVLSFLAFQMGGSGGDGGGGGTVSLTQDQLYAATSGAQSTAILAQSIGGGGGTGGSANYFDATIGFNAAFVLGGSGGTGGNGDDVTITLSDSNIATGLSSSSTSKYAPNNATGILAQSIGGGGGNGGSTSAGDLLVAAPTGTGVPLAFNYVATVGGNGGNAGAGGNVTVSYDQSSRLTTIGDASHGILAQSVGGGGGNGGDASALTATLGDKDTVESTATVALGGGTGNVLSDFNSDYAFTTSGGGNAGAVNVTLGTYGSSSNSAGTTATKLTGLAPESTLFTFGDGAHGLLAQSIGGGGGNGGLGNSNAYSQGGIASLEAKISLGGQGGSGGDGASVEIHDFAGYTIQTQGSGSKGLVGQSIGGGGGNSQGGTVFLAAGGGSVSGSMDLGVGAVGGSGGDGGTIYTEHYGRIETFGGDADGIVLQSIGGGGGIGGSLGNDASSHKVLDAIGALKKQIKRLSDSGSSYSFTVDVGGGGGSGGNGNQVKYFHQGQIITQGAWADGVVLQSIGGGGGQGGSSSASGSEVSASVELAIGGKGGSGGDGGEVAIWLPGSDNSFINTAGFAASGMTMQSIGGGGGQGGDGSDNQTGTLAIGGDGGGTGGAGGDGGEVHTYDTSAVTITTSGNDATALVAQSIGGGGGTGGVGSSAETTRVDGSELSVSVGGSGGVAGNGGTIDLAMDTTITTFGNRSHGVLLQSIGGGGGYGVTGSVEGGLDLAIGGTGGAAGNGGAVTFQLTGGAGIQTSGEGAFGLVAQSIGGGGGLAGDATGGSMTTATANLTSGGANGNGGQITLEIDAPINVTGNGSIGIVAQSIGGGGGISGTGTGGVAGLMSTDSVGTAGTIDLEITNQVAATGSRSSGVFAQSQGADGNGTIGITVAGDGNVQGGTDADAAAIRVSGGLNNTLVLNDDAIVQSGASRNGTDDTGSYAVWYTGAGTTANGAILDVTINGTASLYGDVVLTNASGGSAGTVTNNSPNTLADGYLYDANVVNNGRFVLGRERDPGKTVITGNFTQSAQGFLFADIDLNNTDSDWLEVRGDATLAGTLGLKTISLLPARKTNVLSVGGSVSGTLTPQNSLIFDYLFNAEGSDYYFQVTGADFTPNGKATLNRDQKAVAENLQDIWDRGGNNVFGRLFGAIAEEVDNQSGSYPETLNQLLPRTGLAAAVEQTFEMLAFGDSLMSCPVFEDDGAGIAEGSCGWARATGGTGHRAAIGNSPSYNADALTYQLGGQREIAPGWFIGGAAAFQQSWISQASGTVKGDGKAGYLGASLKRELGAWTLSAAAAGSYGTTRFDRNLSISDLSETISSSPGVLAGSVRARIARTFATNSVYVKPYFDFDAIYSRVGHHRESGAYGLEFESTGQWNFAATPSVELGSRLRYKDGTDLRVYGKLGLSFLSSDTWETDARFTNRTAGTSSFKTSLEHEDLFASIGAGIQITSIEGVDLRLEYNGRFSEKLATNSGSLRFSIPF
ncbi:autotransporter outer membrane beta-barrel domain-containing protein [uncultured Roseibium sp.]|uniref:autotransporter outer membrane beta-barrel domain-containing protein n=1 Tax=uncultured Roseibium sp. TaxID=1936171 RepID=UPI003217C0F1